MSFDSRITGSYYRQIVLGQLDQDGDFVFGNTAEVHVDLDERTATVSFAAIGNHDADRARARLAAYEWAIEVAAEVQTQFNANEFDPRYLHAIVDQKKVALGLNRR